VSLLFLGTLACAPGVHPAARGETYAFLVGVSDYQSKDQLRSLNFASTDMVSFAGVLRNSGVPDRNIVNLDDRQSNPRFKPLGRQILKEFHLLLATLEPEDSLIVALSGHGVQLGAEADNYFLPADAELKDPSTLINIKTLYEEMDRSPAGRKLLLVDACRNDPEADNARSAGIAVPPPRRLAEDPVPKGTAALFSCKSEQRSFEDPKLKHGIFFYHVIRAWEGAADLDRNGQVTLEELESFVRRETTTHARSALATIQTPVFRVDRAAPADWVVASVALQRSQGKMFLARNQLSQAIRAYSEAIAINRKDDLAFLGRAIAEGTSGDLQAALRDYEQATQLNPALTVAYVGQAAILIQLNRPAEAIEACNRAIALDAKNARAYFNRGVAREASKDTVGAAQDFQKAAQLDPGLKAR
jgi:tetratricopeptide (TPR) repeat protein